MVKPLIATSWSQSEFADEGFGGIRHGFFTRVGGVSDALYTSLNCGYGSDDIHAHVRDNRGRVQSWLTASDGPLTPHQIHSPRAVIATEAWEPADSPKADAVVTAQRGLAIGILTADCAPVLFADPVARVIGAAHAGWRGALGGVVEATVVKLEEAGAERDRIHACIGPAISADSYEVGAEFKASFVEENSSYGRFFAVPNGQTKSHFDLPAFLMYRLGKLGLGRVENLAQCTYKNESKFFSYRRSTHRNEPDYGRQISAIVIT